MKVNCIAFFYFPEFLNFVKNKNYGYSGRKTGNNENDSGD